MRKRARPLCIGALCAIGALTLVDGGGAASEAPPVGEIAFSFGGRLYAMDPDGSGRVRITGGRFGREDGGDFDPAWSPDGTTLAFVRSRWKRSGDSSPAIFLVRPGRERPRRLGGAGAALFPDWSPDGRQIAFVRGSESYSEIVVTDVEGGGERVVHRQPSHPQRLDALAFPAWSPDGSRIAFTLVTLDRRHHFHPWLYTVSADGGQVTLLAKDASDAAWSPDGRRIAYSSIRDRTGKRCYEQCNYQGELYVMNSDGTGAVRLTHNRGDDRSPSWSPDGRRIAFASDRNSPGANGSEIYSIGADGSCLTWLTNGAPESVQPAWRRTATDGSDPGRCGPGRRRALLELALPDARGARGNPPYWLGAQYEGRLLAWAGGSGRTRRSYSFVYEDCVRWRPSACPPPLQLQQDSVCSRHGSRLAGRAFAAHGLLFVGSGVIVGASHVRLLGGGGPARRLRALRALRRGGRPHAPLPAPALPEALLRRLHEPVSKLPRVRSIDCRD
jgi:TolB protein